MKCACLSLAAGEIGRAEMIRPKEERPCPPLRRAAAREGPARRWARAESAAAAKATLALTPGRVCIFEIE